MLPLAAAVLVVGCAGPEEADARYLPTPIGEVREYFPLEDGEERMPLFVGMSYGQAVTAADKLDLVVSEDDASGAGRAPSFDDWTVVSQDPLPGAGVDLSRTLLRVSVLPRSEVSDEAAPDPHLEEQRFTGEITGYTTAGSDIWTVMVDGAQVQLDLVAPISFACDAAATVAAEAEAAKAQVLPIGSRVLVIRTEQGDDRGFLHSWPTDVEPPAASLNEMLVRTGWWIPSGAFDGGFGTAFSSTAFTPFTVDPAADDIHGSYSSLIAAAGNEGAQYGAAGYGLCLTDLSSQILGQEAWRQELDRRTADWWAVYQKQRESGTYYCRDGDGDGVCYER